MEAQARSELTSLLRRLLTSQSEEEQSALSARMNEICPDPEWSDYSFMSDEFVLEDGAFDYNGFVEKVLSYRPRLL